MPMNLAELALKLRICKDAISAANKKVDVLKAEKALIDNDILTGFTELGNGANALQTDSGRIGINKLVVAKVEDWEQFYEWVYKNKAGYMLERRVANVAFRESLENEMPIPGLTPFTKKTISLTK